jgi:hypothetical protein
VKTLTVALLALGIFAPAVLAQSAEQVMKDRRRVLGGWLGTVRAAESQDKSKHGRYGDLTALRGAHLLDALVFESDKPAETGPDTNVIPTNAHFEVTVSGDGKHYKVSIWESSDEWSVSVDADEMSGGWGLGRAHRAPPPEDGPEGPILSRAG